MKYPYTKPAHMLSILCSLTGPCNILTCPGCGGQVVYGTHSSSLVTYGVIHISRGYIPAQVRILGISCHISFVYYISFDTLGSLRAFRKPFSIYVFIQSLDCKSYINNKDIVLWLSNLPSGNVRKSFDI